MRTQTRYTHSSLALFGLAIAAAVTGCGASASLDEISEESIAETHQNLWSTRALPTTIAQANAFHKTQFQHATYNPDGPSGSVNCGPASIAIIFDALGFETSGISVERSIDHARYLMLGRPTGWDDFTWTGVRLRNADTGNTNWTGTGDIATAITNAGGWSETGSGSATLAQKLAEGKPAVLSGKTTETWASKFPVRSSYGTFTAGLGHFIAVVGRRSDGLFLVSDPLYRGGVVAMSGAALGAFNGGSIQFTAAAGIAESFAGVYKNGDYLRMPGDWDSCHTKANCAPGETIAGISEEIGGYGRSALCRKGGTKEYPGATYSFVPLPPGGGNNPSVGRRKVNGTTDWAPGYWKLECEFGQYVAAISQNHPSCQGNSNFHALRCAAGGEGLGSPNACDVRVFDNGDDRATTTTGDWDPGAFKGECGLSQYVAGVSVSPTTWRPHSILCCNR